MAEAAKAPQQSLPATHERAPKADAPGAGFVASQGPFAQLARLQRTVGNQGVQRLLTARPGTILRDAVDDVLGAADKAVKDRFTTAITDHTPKFDQLRAFLDSASQSDRETISGDATLMAKAKTKLAAPDYLSLLLALRIKKAGTVAHKSATEADELITTKLAAYTAGAVKAGRKVSGQVAVLDGADWTMAYEREFGDDGEEATTNAFVDNERDRIFIHKDRGNPGTIIHEGMHKYAPNDLINEIHSPFNEGLTEYFTRKICDSLTPPIPRTNYDSNHTHSKKFVELMGEATVAAAYFDGKVAELKKKYTDSGRDWAVLVQHTKDADWTAATSDLNAPPSPAVSALVSGVVGSAASAGSVATTAASAVTGGTSH